MLWTVIVYESCDRVNNSVQFVVCLCNISICVIFQIEYSGVKHYRDAAGVVLSLTDAKGEVIVSRGEQSVTIENLVPKTPYLFHIRARFADGTWGPRATTQSETLADGMFDVCFFSCFICCQTAKITL